MNRSERSEEILTWLAELKFKVKFDKVWVNIVNNKIEELFTRYLIDVCELSKSDIVRVFKRFPKDE